MRKALPYCLTLVLLGLTGSAALAQTGIISGKVTDAVTGEPLIGATILVQETLQGRAAAADGTYRILNVGPGRYTLEARFLGYQTKIVQGVDVHVDLNTEVNFSLQVAAFEGEEVVVTAERSVVVRDLTSSESRVSRERLQNMPVQELGDVLRLQSGVSVGAGGAIHIRGGRATEVGYIVDGVRVTDDYDRSSGLRIENQAIQEVQVVSGTFNAEYGQAMSGIINIVTRSGSNTFEGNFRAWGGDYATGDADLYDGLPGSVTDVQPWQQYNFEGSIAGPIVRDRLTLFVSGRRFRNPGWMYGRNVYSPHGPLMPGQDELGRNIWEPGRTEVSRGNPVNIFGEQVVRVENGEIVPAAPWIEIIQVTDDVIRYRDTGLRDSALVTLNNFDTYSFHGNLQYNASPSLRFNLIGNYGQEWGRSYSHVNRLVPHGRPQFDRQNYYANLRTTITPSANTFITTNAAVRFNRYETSLYGTPADLRYFNYDRLGDLGPFWSLGQEGRFNRLGTHNGFFNRDTQTFVGKIEGSNQWNAYNLVKTGIEVQADILNFRSFGLEPLEGSEDVFIPDDTSEEMRQYMELGIPRESTVAHEVWTRQPVTFSAYVQNRLDYENLVINAGLRFDYFQPNARIPADTRDPDLFRRPDERHEDFWQEASAKYQLSPRIGIAYPITERGVIHFSYGYFFQIPDFNRLYNNDNIILQNISGVQGIFGNPDLKPEQSIKYEIGLQQELFPGIALSLAGYYEDKRHYVSSGPVRPTSNPGVRYGTWINRDYANIRGVTVSLDQRVRRNFYFGFDYTFQVAEDSNSDPASEFFAAIARGDTTGQNLARFLTLSNWDRTHILNSTFYYVGSGWGFNVIQRFSSGLPYTPSTLIPRRVGITASSDPLVNSLRMAPDLSFDVNAYTEFALGGQKLRMFFYIYNLFDARNTNFVYADSGQPDMPLTRPQEFDPGYYNNPGHYAEPRRVQVGLEFSF